MLFCLPHMAEVIAVKKDAIKREKLLEKKRSRLREDMSLKY